MLDRNAHSIALYPCIIAFQLQLFGFPSKDIKTCVTVTFKDRFEKISGNLMRTHTAKQPFQRLPIFGLKQPNPGGSRAGFQSRHPKGHFTKVLAYLEKSQ